MAATTAKLSILVEPAVKRRLEAEARAKKTTVGDIVRRRLDGESDPEERLFMTALAELGRRAQTLFGHLDATRAEIEHDSATWAKREAEIRKATLASLTSKEAATLAAWMPQISAAPASVRKARR